jgi:hypothetical protein
VKKIYPEKEVIKRSDLQSFGNLFAVLKHWCDRRDRIKKVSSNKANRLAREMDNRCRKMTKFINDNGEGILVHHPFWFMGEVDHLHKMEDKINDATKIAKKSIIGRQDY